MLENLQVLLVEGWAMKILQPHEDRLLGLTDYSC